MFNFFIKVVKNDKVKKMNRKIWVLSQNDPFIKKYIYKM